MVVRRLGLRSRYDFALLLVVAALAPSRALSQSAADSSALARLAARLAADEIPHRPVLDSARSAVVVEPPLTSWDSAVAREIRALRPEAFRPVADTLHALHVARVRVTFADTVAYLMVSSSGCAKEPDLNAWRHVLEYEVKRTNRPDSATWRIAGRPMQTFIDGTCGPARRPRP